jgi:glycosyltransferase involved in cell wall biosynthesis
VQIIESQIDPVGSGAALEAPPGKPLISIAIIAWNEEKIIGSTLSSLFGQSIFSELSRRGQICEVVCVVNGTSDKTAEVASRVLAMQQTMHPYSRSFRWRVVDIPERGKLNAWNKYVHSISAPEAEYLILMDADIRFFQPHTLWNMVTALYDDPEAHVAVDRPRKDILLKEHKTIADRISIAVSRLTGSAEGQLCGQLYVIRSKIARNIYLPKDMTVEDGFIKAMVCTDFLEHGVLGKRIRMADQAEHTFEAYTTPKVVIKNQKRQIIAQTVVHILVDQYLKALPADERQRMGETLMRLDGTKPDWLKRLISGHLRAVRYFWRLYPGVITHRFRQMRKLPAHKRPFYVPIGLLSCGVALTAAFMAWRTLRAGSTDYWPKAERGGSGGVAERGLEPA